MDPLDHVSITQQVYERLSHDIFTGELRPAQRLDVSRLAHDLGVSTQPIKEALSRLSLKRLIDILPRRGTFVRAISLVEAQQLLQVRLMIEMYAIADAANFDAQTEQLMTTAIHSMQRILDVEPFDWVRYNQYDVQFHGALIGMARNQVLEALYNSLHFHHATGRYWVNREEKTRRNHSDHALILTALRDGDSDAARAHLQRHITSSITILNQEAQHEHNSLTTRQSNCQAAALLRHLNLRDTTSPHT